MLSSSDGWAVGDGGTIIEYQGSSGQWSNFPSPTGMRLNSVFILDSNDGWAVGAGGTILHFDGNTWTSVSDFVSTNLNSVYQTSPQEAWIVGDSATILHWTGVSWYPYTPSPSLAGNPDLESVFMLPDGFGLIVGEPSSPGGQGTIYPIPEFHQPQILIVLVLVALLLLIRRRHNRKVRN
jgi:photosystem II stability/assembly factor-like uncharacterized protein